ncbi:acyltransferase family protein [Methylobacterium brachythecii]|uniref:Peptidoglycan/LPS O-acetylase OafA/YrhL n=1 Tax=Methylobacterium brachythecii TaxID=1176177 RepID=A0A7W6AJ54_9HYPH|nr:acyltransferase [Methylobacterium brachythecii]MBB3902129.1 peptidoglycan/LPS O-acetylase OafA/YrhL [Methylobacterium brachythecii]GLS44526.1 hypothetical protein GCM10007884_25140 [Methylobacterium brachythecii]
MAEDSRLAPGHPIPALDGLRALSILLVMVSHTGLQDRVPGVFGVTVFFFISGFLVTTLMIGEHRRSGTIAVRAFYMRRLLRLYPPLIVSVVIVGAVWVAAGGRLDLLGVAGALAYLTNYLVILAPQALDGIGGQLWSLAVEQHFYLLFPWLMLALLPHPARLARVLACLCAASLAIRIGVALAAPEAATQYNGVATECRIDAILFGALAALLVADQAGQRWVTFLTQPTVVAAALAVLLATFLIRDEFFRSTLRYTIQSLALVSPILALTSTGRFPAVRAVLDSRPLVAIGILSYSLYLWHLAALSLGEAVAIRLAWPQLAGAALGWALAFAAAWISYRAVERPVLGLRRRFGSRVAPTEGAASLHRAAAASAP